MSRKKSRRKKWFKASVKTMQKQKRKEVFEKEFRDYFVGKGILKGDDSDVIGKSSNPKRYQAEHIS